MHLIESVHCRLTSGDLRRCTQAAGQLTDITVRQCVVVKGFLFENIKKTGRHIVKSKYQKKR